MQIKADKHMRENNVNEKIEKEKKHLKVL